MQGNIEFLDTHPSLHDFYDMSDTEKQFLAAPKFEEKMAPRKR